MRTVVRSGIPPVALLFAVACATPAPEPEAPAPAAAADRAPPPPPLSPTAPEPGPAPMLELPAITRQTLANGLEVMWVPRDQLPVVHATLLTRGGRSDAPAGAPELADFTADMLDEGAGGRGALELAAAIEALGASLSARAGWDAVEIDLEVLRPRLGPALELMADVVVRPDFAPAEIERKRELRLTELVRARDEARVIADNAFQSLVFGPDHPYGRLETTAATESIGRADLVDFHRQHFRPGASTLVVVGDVDPATDRALVERAFEGWRGHVARQPVAPEPPEVATTTIYLIDKPGAPQSELRIGHPGVSRDDPDYFALRVLNTLLGGSFTSRLNMNLREAHGYSYGARSTFAMRRGAGPFIASSAVVAEKTDSSVVEVFRELRRIREEAVSPAELERAKNYVALGLPRRFETTGSVAGSLADLAIYGIGPEFYERYVPGIMAITADDVRRVAREHLRPDRSVVVVVGDADRIEPGLRALDIGTVEVRTVDEFVR